jgi:hypothetical protein
MHNAASGYVDGRFDGYRRFPNHWILIANIHCLLIHRVLLLKVHHNILPPLRPSSTAAGSFFRGIGSLRRVCACGDRIQRYSGNWKSRDVLEADFLLGPGGGCDGARPAGTIISFRCGVRQESRVRAARMAPTRNAPISKVQSGVCDLGRFARCSLRVSVNAAISACLENSGSRNYYSFKLARFLSEYRQRTTVVTTIRAKQISMNNFPASNQSTAEFIRSGSVKRLCQKSAAAAK